MLTQKNQPAQTLNRSGHSDPRLELVVLAFKGTMSRESSNDWACSGEIYGNKCPEGHPDPKHWRSIAGKGTQSITTPAVKKMAESVSSLSSLWVKSGTWWRPSSYLWCKSPLFPGSLHVPFSGFHPISHLPYLLYVQLLPLYWTLTGNI